MATLAEQIAHDYAKMDGIATVELRDERGSTAIPFTGCKALKRSIKLGTMMAAGIGFGDQSATWHVWVATISGAKPDRGWVLVETENGGKRWSILSANLETLDTRYRLICTAEVVK